MKERVIKMLIRTLSVLENSDGKVISKDQQLIDNRKTCTAVEVLSSLISNPVNDLEHDRHGQHAEDIYAFFERMLFRDDTFAIKVQHAILSDNPNLTMIVWAPKVYRDKQVYLKNLNNLYDEVVYNISYPESAIKPPDRVNGICNVLAKRNNANGSKTYHLVDIDTKRYLRYTAYGKCTLDMLPDSNVKYSASVKRHVMSDQLKVWTTDLAKPKFMQA